VPAKALGEAAQPVVDVLAATLHEAVGVQDEGGAGGVRQLRLGPGEVGHANAQGRVGGLVEEVDGAVGLEEHGWEVTGAAVGDRLPRLVDDGLDGGAGQRPVDGACVPPEPLERLPELLEDLGFRR
jgi:hypothetical protein